MSYERWGDGPWYIYAMDADKSHNTDYDEVMLVHIDLDNSIEITVEEILKDRSAAAHRVLEVNDNVHHLSRLFRIFDLFLRECGQEENANKGSKKR